MSESIQSVKMDGQSRVKTNNNFFSVVQIYILLEHKTISKVESAITLIKNHAKLSMYTHRYT